MAYNATQIPDKLYDCTPSDTDPNAGFGFRVYTTAGDVMLGFIDGTTGLCASVQVGEVIGCNFARVMDTGTTAEGITVFGPN